MRPFHWRWLSNKTEEEISRCKVSTCPAGRLSDWGEACRFKCSRLITRKKLEVAEKVVSSFSRPRINFRKPCWVDRRLRPRKWSLMLCDCDMHGDVKRRQALIQGEIKSNRFWKGWAFCSPDSDRIGYLCGSEKASIKSCKNLFLSHRAIKGHRPGIPLSISAPVWNGTNQLMETFANVNGLVWMSESYSRLRDLLTLHRRVFSQEDENLNIKEYFFPLKCLTKSFAYIVRSTN